MARLSTGICGRQVHAGPPFLFTFAARLIRWGVRGGHRLAAFASKGVVVQYDLGEGFQLTIPIYREDNRYELSEILSYEAQLLRTLASAAGAMSGPTFIDCGADIGMVTTLLCRLAPSIARVVAFEPNADVIPYLSRNLDLLARPALMLGHAVGSYNGAGRLVSADADPSDHARFIVADPQGDIRVITIDSLGISGDLVLKIDVEGGESAVIEGANKTIGQAPRCAISFEAHPDVAARTGRDPIEIARLLGSIRQFDFTVTSPTTSRQLTSTSEPIFRPDSAREILNVVAVSRG